MISGVIFVPFTGLVDTFLILEGIVIKIVIVIAGAVVGAIAG